MKNITIDQLSLKYDTAEKKLDFIIPDNIKDLKIIDATLEIEKTLPVKASNFQVKFLSALEDPANTDPWIIDELTNIENNKRISINISDELQYCLNNSIQNFAMGFIDSEGESIEFNIEGRLKIDFIPNSEFQGNGNKNKIELGKAGVATINLVSGDMNISTPLVSSNNKTLPFSINANYNTKPNDLLKNIGMPKNWTLNFHQFLIRNEDKSDKEKSSVTSRMVTGPGSPIFVPGSGDLTLVPGGSLILGHPIVGDKDHMIESDQTEEGDVLSFTYIDQCGKNHIIEESYYVNDVKKDRKDLSVDPDGSLVFIDKSKTETEEGYKQKVTTKLISPDGIKLVSSIEGLKGSSLVDYKPEELSKLEKSISKLKDTIETTKASILIGREQYCLNVLQLYKILKDKPPKYEIANGDYTPYEVTLEDFSYFKSVIIGGSYISDEAPSIDEDEKNPIFPEEYLRDFYNKNKGSEGDFSDIEFDERFKREQILSSYMNLYNSVKSLKEYNDQLKKYDYQKKQLELQVPVYYLYDEENIIYGFGKTNDSKVFRLILITDPYENNLFISYPSLEDNKIETISDADNNYATFTYNENELLESIQDMQDRVVKLNYPNSQNTNNLENQNIEDNSSNANTENFNKLESITFSDNASSYFYYDEDDKIIDVLNENGLGTTFTYDKSCIKKIESFSILDNVSNGKITYTSGDGKFSSNIKNYTKNMIEDNKIKIDYNNYKSTTITNSKDKSITYLFDNYGNTTATYENSFKENNENCIAATTYNYSNNLLSEKISKLVYSKNFLSDVSFSEKPLEVKSASFVGTTICSDHTFMGQKIEKENLFCLPNEDNQEKCISVNVSDDMIIELNKDYSNETDIFEKLCDHRTFIVSGWAKADSAFIKTDETGDFPEYISSRKFKLRVNVKYKNIIDGEQPSPFIRSFDWRNTNWQYCAVPIELDHDQEIESITCCIDYSNNTGSIKFTNLELCEGDFEHIDFYDNKKPRLKYSSHSKWQTNYEYDKNDNLIKEIISIRNFKPIYESVKEYDGYGQIIGEKLITKQLTSPTYTTTYEYNKNGKLFKTIDYKGIVTENIYNDKGRIIKTLTYHKDEPANIFYEEHSLDDKGNENNSTNEFGEIIESYEYQNNTNIVETSTDFNGNKTSFGYDNCGRLLQKTTSVNGIENANTYGYILDFLTSLKHNNFEITYSYDNLGRNSSIDIADENYLTKTFSKNEEVITFSNKERYKKIFNDNGKLQQLYFKSKNDETDFTENDLIVSNIYDTHDNLVSLTEANSHRTHKYFIDKFGKTYKEEVSFSNGEDISTPFILENTYDEEHDKVEATKICVENKVLNYEYLYSDTPDKTLTGITLPNKLKQNLNYDKLGRLDKINIDTYFKQFSYLKYGNKTSNLVSSLSFATNDFINDRLYYKYDRKGNITEIRNNNNLLIARYSYDSLNRLIREDNNKFGKTFTYSYDAGGNILDKLEYNFTLTDNLEYEEIVKENKYSYSANGWKDKLLKFNNESFEYDNKLGNPNVYRGKELSWSHGRQLDRFDSIEFHYDSNGLRLSKIANGIFTKYYLNGNKIIAQDVVSKDDNKNNYTLYFHYGTDGITSFEYNNENYIYKKNAQNDIIGIYDTNGQEIAKYHYDAWGNHTIEIWNGEKFVDISEVSSDNDYRNVAEINPFRYRSYYYDSETNLYYLNSRYYDPELGRFINADDISILNQSKEFINGLNLFSYCNNNPITNTDEDGNAWWDWLWKIAVAVVVVVAVVAVTAVTAGAAAAFLGASATVCSGIITGAFVGGLIAGVGEIISQSLTVGIDNLDLWSIGIQSFAGAAIGALTGLGSTTTNVGLRIFSRVGKIAVSGITSIAHGINNGDSFGNIVGNTIASMLFSALLQGVLLGNDFLNCNLSSEGLRISQYIGQLNYGLKEIFITGGVISLISVWQHIKRLRG